MSHLIKKLYLICESFSDVNEENKGNNKNIWGTSITWFAYGRHERGRETCTLALLKQPPRHS